MRYRVFVAMFVCAWLPASVGAAPPAWAEGDWIGGFRGRDGTVYVSAHVERQDDKLSGTLDLPLAGDVALEMQRLKADDDSLKFDVQSSRTTLRFEGHRRPGRVSGIVRQSYASASFELLKVAPLTPERVDAIAGTYELEPGHIVLIAKNNGGLMYVDHAADRVGALFALEDGTLVAGPTIGSGYPVAVKIAVAGESGGAVQTITWDRNGRAPVVGVRRTLYRMEQIGFYNGDVRLSATLVLPNGPGPHPAVVMVQGSGSATRDALRPWADVYARAGVAVLIHDKRGTGSSTGSWARATFEDLAGDAIAGLRYLQSRSEIDPAQIGLHGMSLGSWVAPLAAQQSGQVAFIIAESAPALTPLEHERVRVEHQMRADDVPSEILKRAQAFMDQKFEVARTGQGWETLQTEIDRAKREGWAYYVNPPPSLENLQWHWQHVLTYDPRPALERLKCPVLVLYGALDRIVPASVNRAGIEAALAKSPARDVTIKVFERANHSFLEAGNGGRHEAPSLRGFVAGYLDTHVRWLESRVQKASGFAPSMSVATTLFDESLDSFKPFLALPGNADPSYLPRSAVRVP